MWYWLTTYWFTSVGVRTSLTKCDPHPPRHWPGAAGVGEVVAAAQDVREQRLVDLGRRLDEVAVRRRRARPTRRRRCTALTQPALISPPWSKNASPGARVAVAPHLARAAVLVGLRRAPVGEDLRHRDRDRVADLDAGMVRAARDRLALGVGFTHVPSGHAQVDAVEEALVLRDRRVDEARELRDRVAARVAERRPRLDLRAVVGAVEVDDEPVAVDRDRDVHVDVAVARRIGVDVHVGLVGAVGPAPRSPSEKRRWASAIVQSTAALHRVGAVAAR